MPPRLFLLSPATCTGARAQVLLSPRAQFPLAQQLRTAAGAPLGEVFSFLSGLYFRGKLTYALTFGRVAIDRGRRPSGSPEVRTSGSRGVRRPVRTSDSPRVRQSDVLSPKSESRSRQEGSSTADERAIERDQTFGRALRRPRPDVRTSGQSSATGLPPVLVITPSLGLLPPDYPVTPSLLEEFARVDIHAANEAYTRPLEASAVALNDAAGPDADVVLLGSIATGKYVDILLRVFGDRLLFPAEFVGRGDMSRGGLLLRCVRAGEELTYIPVNGAVRHGARPPRLPRLPRG